MLEVPISRGFDGEEEGRKERKGMRLRKRDIEKGEEGR